MEAEPDKSPEFDFSAAQAERKAILRQNAKPVSPTSVEQIEVEKVLKEMADIIEAEDGILTP